MSGWEEQALCRQVFADFWFPEKGEPVQAAKAVCRRCPVQTQCLNTALDNDERFGVWGGLTAWERSQLTGRRKHVSRLRSCCVCGTQVSRARALYCSQECFNKRRRARRNRAS